MASKYFAVVLWIILLFSSAVDSEPDELDVGLRFTRSPDDVTAIRGAPLWLHCDARSTSQQGGDVTIFWEKDGIEISDSRHVIYQNGTLYFKRVVHKKRGRSDAGEYQCFAKNNYGTIAAKKIQLKIGALERFSGNPERTYAKVGELVRLECRIEGTPLPTITWEKSRQPLPQDDRYNTLPSGVLQIRNVKDSDAGLYRCKAVNVAKERQSSEAELSVVTDSGNLESRLVQGPQDATRLQGEEVIFECAISYLPQDSKIKWSRLSGRPVAGERADIVGQGNLRIRDVQLSDGGTYVCTAGNIQARAKLTVYVPPTLTSVSESVAKPAASIQRFNCEFSGYPTPEITWTHNSQPITTSGRIKVNHDNNELLISNLVIEDSGIYQCWGRNEAGVAIGTSRIYIELSENAPGPPANVVADALGPTSIRVDWEGTPSKNGYPTMAYTVHYVCVCDSVMGRKERQEVVQETTVTVKELLPYTNYTFYVRAYNNMAASPPSWHITATTLEDVPIAAPIVQVSPHGSNALKVTWGDLAPEMARGKITQYQIKYRLKGSPSQQVIHLDRSNIHEYIITDLEQNKEYEVRVEAGTMAGFPSLDDSDNPWVPLVTNEESKGVPAPPIFTEVKTLNSTAIRLSWEDERSINPGGFETLGFRLSYHMEGESEKPFSRVFVSSVVSHTIHNLKPETKYEISLLAFNQLGDSESSVVIAFTQAVSGGPVPPPPPHNLDVEPINETAVKLSWQTPPFGTSVASFTVKYIPVTYKDGREMSDISSEKYVETDHTSLVVANLEPYTIYEFSVKSHTPDVSGKYSRKIRVRTEEGTPGAPTNPQWSLQGPRIIELRWQPPAEKNGVIQSYVILYSDEPDTPDEKWKMKSQNGNMTKAIVQELRANALYYFKLRATTSKGVGPPSRILEVQTHSAYGPERPGGQNGTRGSTSDREMGIIVGVCIGGACIIICAIIIILRNKCFPPRPPPPADPDVSYHHGNGCMVVVNGNGYIPGHHHDDSRTHLRPSNDFQEMDSFTPMLTRIPENENSDSKGGYLPGYNGGNGIHGYNGYKSTTPNHLRATYNSNGQVRTYLTNSDDGYSDSCEDSHLPLRGGSADETRPRELGHPCPLEELDEGLSAEDLEISEDSGWDPHLRPLPPEQGDGGDTSPPQTEQHPARAGSTAAVPTPNGGFSSSSPPTAVYAGGRGQGDSGCCEDDPPGSRQQDSRASSSPHMAPDGVQGNRAANTHRLSPRNHDTLENSGHHNRGVHGLEQHAIVT